MPPDRSLPIIDLTYRLVLEVNRAVGEFPRSQRPGLGRRGEAAAFDLLEALSAARYARGPEKQARLVGASSITVACRAAGTWLNSPVKVMADRQTRVRIFVEMGPQVPAAASPRAGRGHGGVSVPGRFHSPGRASTAVDVFST